jgi:predicted Fe-Mo cluster-binding NifX family protein
MKVAIPIEDCSADDKRCSPHFGDAPCFAIVNTETNEIEYWDKVKEAQSFKPGRPGAARRGFGLQNSEFPGQKHDDHDSPHHLGGGATVRTLLRYQVDTLAALSLGDRAWKRLQEAGIQVLRIQKTNRLQKLLPMLKASLLPSFSEDATHPGGRHKH